MKRVLAAVCCAALAAGPGAGMPVSSLLAPRTNLAARISAAGWTVVPSAGGWRVTGRGGRVVLTPIGSARWDLSGWNYAGTVLVNRGGYAVIVEGRLDNPGAQDWTDCSPSTAVILPGESAVLGFPFTRPDASYAGAEIFRPQLARPNGHRLHWRAFDPADVRALRLTVQSAGPDVQLEVAAPYAAWPVDAQRDRGLEAMPYLDALGQVRALEWPGKTADEDALRAQLQRAAAVAQAAAWPTGFDRFGGWAAGPQLKATGRFRTEKRDGRWWLVDPDGRLFWSAGVCCAGWEAATAVTSARRTAGFFAWLPDRDDPAAAVALRTGKRGDSINFPALNLWRAFGTNWMPRATELIHGELHAWGVNTLGAWSGEAVLQARRTPYTLTTSVWWPVWRDGDAHRPSPFGAEFGTNLRGELRKLEWAKDDPYCLGVFVDNELAWPDQFAPAVLAAAGWEPVRAWVVEQLRGKYVDLAGLNQAWGTAAGGWSNLLAHATGDVARADIESLYEPYARTYFAACRAAINDVLPGALYLGCRTHRGPQVLGRAARGLVDVFSANCYDARAAVRQVDDDVDLPVLVGEFHFGAVDRGVPSPGLRAVADQRQRGLAYAQYLASALSNPRMVGCHWFQWLDQSAAGRGDRENHQVGFVDVAGRPYPEFVAGVARANARLYEARAVGGRTEEVLGRLVDSSAGLSWRRGDPAPSSDGPPPLPDALLRTRGSGRLQPDGGKEVR